MSPAERFLQWLWDPRGKRRIAQQRRQHTTALRLRASLAVQKRAIEQIRLTQEFVRQHGGS